jgi:hypothetical protein
MMAEANDIEVGDPDPEINNVEVRVIAPVPALDDGEVTSPCSVHK